MSTTLEPRCQGCLAPATLLYADPRGLVRLGDQHPALWCRDCFAKYLHRQPEARERVAIQETA